MKITGFGGKPAFDWFEVTLTGAISEIDAIAFHLKPKRKGIG